jgi:hypothetical protein
MRNIYTQASLVVAWFGNDIVLAWYWMKMENYLGSMAPEDNEYHEGYTQLNSLSSRFLKEFLANKYWSRVWIVQEYVLARKITIRFGECCITGERVEELLNFGEEHRRSEKLSKVFLGSSAEPVLLRRWQWHQTSADLITFKRESRWSKEPSQIPQGSLSEPTLIQGWQWPPIDGKKDLENLEAIVIAFGDAQCADPRDHVYGLLSICNQTELAGASIVPDYSKSAFELWAQLAEKAYYSRRNPFSKDHSCEHDHRDPDALRKYAETLRCILRINAADPVYSWQCHDD